MLLPDSSVLIIVNTRAHLLLRFWREVGALLRRSLALGPPLYPDEVRVSGLPATPPPKTCVSDLKTPGPHPSLRQLKPRDVGDAAACPQDLGSCSS